jgi:hypothetical protein
VRSCKPDPLCADIVHVREDGGDGADLARRFGGPGGRVEMFDEDLIHAFVCRKNPEGGSTELSANLGLTRGHSSLLLDRSYFRVVRLRCSVFENTVEGKRELSCMLKANLNKR